MPRKAIYKGSEKVWYSKTKGQKNCHSLKNGCYDFEFTYKISIFVVMK